MKRFSEHEIMEACRVNLIAYAQELGLSLKKTGSSYKVKEYGGLYIDSEGSK